MQEQMHQLREEWRESDLAWERRCRREAETLREQIRLLQEENSYEERGRRRSARKASRGHKDRRSRSCHHYETGEETTEVEESRSCCAHSKQRSKSRKSECGRIKTSLTPTVVATSTLNAFSE